MKDDSCPSLPSCCAGLPIPEFCTKRREKVERERESIVYYCYLCVEREREGLGHCRVQIGLRDF